MQKAFFTFTETKMQCKLSHIYNPYKIRLFTWLKIKSIKQTTAIF